MLSGLNSAMKIGTEFSYRYAKEILQAVSPDELEDIQAVLNNPQNLLDTTKANKQRNYSAQIKEWFISQKDWKRKRGSHLNINIRTPKRVTLDYADQFAAKDGRLYNLPT
jgi:hypothetical protein